MSVMLSFGLALGALAYKQQMLASSSVGSQYAFYVADAALECALYADQRENIFAYKSNLSEPAPVMSCDGATTVSSEVVTHTLAKWVIRTRLSFDAEARCADVMVYKPVQGTDVTYLFSQGYNVSCTTLASPGSTRISSRGVNAHY